MARQIAYILDAATIPGDYALERKPESGQRRTSSGYGSILDRIQPETRMVRSFGGMADAQPAFDALADIPSTIAAAIIRWETTSSREIGPDGPRNYAERHAVGLPKQTLIRKGCRPWHHYGDGNGLICWVDEWQEIDVNGRTYEAEAGPALTLEDVIAPQPLPGRRIS